MHNKNSIARTVIAGLGRIGWQYHIPEIIKHKGFELVAVMDPLQERLDEAKEIFGLKGYLDYREMIETERPNLVVIASPSKFHYEQILVAFEYECDVFCEKPIVLCVEEIDKIISFGRKKNTKIMSFQPHRGYRDVASLKHILSSGLLGPIFMIKRNVFNYRRRCDWQAFIKNGGGMLNNYGIHFIDQLMYFTGFSPIASLQCIMKKIASRGDAEDVVKILMETDSHITIDLDINMASALKSPAWQVFGHYGSAELYENQQAWNIRYFSPEELKEMPVQSSLAALDRSYDNGEVIPWKQAEVKLSDFENMTYYDYCYKYFVLNEDPLVPVSESRCVLEIIERCRKTAAQ